MCRLLIEQWGGALVRNVAKISDNARQRAFLYRFTRNVRKIRAK